MFARYTSVAEVPRRSTPRSSAGGVNPTRVDAAVSVMREENMPRVMGIQRPVRLRAADRPRDRIREGRHGMGEPGRGRRVWPTAARLRARASEEAGVSFGPPDNLTVRATVPLD